jgi:outer membrane protein OmpU
MDKFKKIGVTALAGALAATSAHAGELSVTGGANLTYKWGDAETSTNSTTSKAIGFDKDVAFTGSGELDNGTTFSFFTATNDSQTDLSSGAMTISTPSFGSFLLGHDSGGAHYKYDEEVPQVYEQISDISKHVTQNKVGDFMDNNHITYTSPTFDFGGASITLDVGYTTQASDTETGDGGTLNANAYGEGKEAGITIAYDALKLGVYGAERENNTPNNPAASAGAADAVQDEFNGVWYAKYNFGPVSVGYSQFYVDAGVAQTAVVATNAAKTLRTSGGFTEGDQIGIAFNVNDNFSISYTESTETYDAQDHATTAIADVDQKIDAIQLAYSMGGMSIKVYQMEVENAQFDEDASDETETEIALGLAF